MGVMMQNSIYKFFGGRVVIFFFVLIIPTDPCRCVDLKLESSKICAHKIKKQTNKEINKKVQSLQIGKSPKNPTLK